MKKNIVIFLIILLTSFNLYAFEQSLTPKQNITVGDKVTLNIKADGLTPGTIDKTKLSELNFGDFELLDIKQAADGSTDFILSVYKTGKVELLSVEIPYTYENQNKFVKTKAEPLEVKSVIDPKNLPQDIQDIKGIAKFSHGILWYLTFILIFLALAVLVYYLIKKFMKEFTNDLTPEEIIQSIPPKEYALKQLEELSSENLPQKGQIKEYYDKLSDIIRFYLKRTYFVDTMERTTTELYQMLKDKIAPEHNREIKIYLQNCDFVKFAKLVPSDEDIKKDFDTAKEFIEKL